MEKTYKLKPCPFCGKSDKLSIQSENAIQPDGFYYYPLGLIHSLTYTDITISCTCGLSYSLTVTSEQEMPETIVNKWNTRLGGLKGENNE